jgi:hypothetical protein
MDWAVRGTDHHISSGSRRHGGCYDASRKLAIAVGPKHGSDIQRLYGRANSELVIIFLKRGNRHFPDIVPY